MSTYPQDIIVFYVMTVLLQTWRVWCLTQVVWIWKLLQYMIASICVVLLANTVLRCYWSDDYSSWVKWFLYYQLPVTFSLLYFYSGRLGFQKWKDNGELKHFFCRHKHGTLFLLLAVNLLYEFMYCILIAQYSSLFFSFFVFLWAFSTVDTHITSCYGG